MKVDELMINDWVLSHSGTPCVITTIFNNDGNYWATATNVRIDYGAPIECYQPIPLTAEILKKICTSVIYKPSMKRWVIDGELELIEDRMGDADLEYWFSVSDQYVCPIHYVHQLQHALRLVGLNDLANKFIL